MPKFEMFLLMVRLNSTAFIQAHSFVFGLSQTFRTTAEHPSHKCFIYSATVFIPKFLHIWILFNNFLVDVEEREMALMFHILHCCQLYQKHKLIMSVPAYNLPIISHCLPSKAKPSSAKRHPSSSFVCLTFCLNL